MSCRIFFAATHTAMPPLMFAPTLGYIGCPVVRVRHRLPQWLGLHAAGGLGSWSKIANFSFLMDDGL